MRGRRAGRRAAAAAERAIARAVLIALAASAIGLAGGVLAWSEADAGADIAPAAPAARARETRHLLSADEARRAVAAGLLPPGTRSILAIDRALRYGDFVWNEAGASNSAARLVTVDLRRQVLSVFRGGDEIGTAVILYGADGHATPLGTFPIRAKLRHHRSAQYDAEMPYTLRLTDDGVAIHASNVRWGRATHGCIGVPAGLAARLFALAHVGDPVRITRSPR